MSLAERSQRYLRSLHHPGKLGKATRPGADPEWSQRLLCPDLAGRGRLPKAPRSEAKGRSCHLSQEQRLPQNERDDALEGGPDPTRLLSGVR